MEGKFGQDSEFKLVHIGPDKNSYYRLLDKVCKLEMMFVICDNLQNGIGCATETAFSQLCKLLYSFLVM